mmetsp:Transcript_3776/g.5861  ORF Transcript_3776/g.5861 Transcript_3776/m.5861 type:complete len:229 (-) Transcript_3776:401-1087(-)
MAHGMSACSALSRVGVRARSSRSGPLSRAATRMTPQVRVERDKQPAQVREAELEKQQAHTTTAHAVSVSGTRRGAAVGAAIALALSAHVHAAVAKPVSITIDPAKLTSQVCANPRAAGTPGTATYKAMCVEIVGTAFNPTKETVYNADIYGSVKDKANDDVLSSGRVGSIAKLQPGDNLFRVEISVAVSQPLPLKLKSFKAQGATGVLTGSPNPYDDYTDIDEYGGVR